ncbi:abscisic acid 8'-hydroxylase 4 [Quercus suber]|uniref:Abscisic acid 8'-hydroxylase 4 n=1 Tax=Quercus suber TaxID=58331 RepID=A0AAW0LL92_QUESU
METVSIVIYIFIFLSTLFSYPLIKKQKKKHERLVKLPPGSMGWPLIGETLQLYSQDPKVFFTAKQKRYGEIFKSHILGCPCVMLASPEAARFVLVSHAHLFRPTYPKSKEKMIGPSALFFHQGSYHSHLRKLVQSSLSPESIRKLAPDIEAIAISALDSWASGQVVNSFHEMKKFSFDVGILSIFGRLDDKYREKLKENYCIVDKDIILFQQTFRVLHMPKHSRFLNLTLFAPTASLLYVFKARKRLSEIVSEIICEREEKKLLDKDLLGYLLNFKDERAKF